MLRAFFSRKRSFIYDFNPPFSSKKKSPATCYSCQGLPSPQRCLTSVFGMGTGVSTAPSSPDSFSSDNLWKLDNNFSLSYFFLLFLSPRPISITRLNASLHLHLWPINLVTFKGSYFLRMRSLILGSVSRLDAFSVYPFHT